MYLYQTVWPMLPAAEKFYAEITAHGDAADPSERCLPNTFVLFRRELRLEEPPRRATGWIAADSRYRLDVNGQRYIGTGIRGKGLRIEVHGTPGQDMAMLMDGPTMEVFGNAQDGAPPRSERAQIKVHVRDYPIKWGAQDRVVQLRFGEIPRGAGLVDIGLGRFDVV